MEVQWQNSFLSISISDDGPGFSDDALQKAATVFYKENSENDHFGLGLFICDTSRIDSQSYLDVSFPVLCGMVFIMSQFDFVFRVKLARQIEYFGV